MALKQKSWKTNTYALLIALHFSLMPKISYALPEHERTVAGDIQLEHADENNLNIHQNSGKAIVEWKHFNIHGNETVNILQPSSESILLNRVLGEKPSEIFGQLNANGHVWILNSAGVLFGENSEVDVGGLLVTTADIENEDFLSGTYEFRHAGLADASIINDGSINSDGGIVALLAPNVSNNGVIKAYFGKVIMASADTFTVDFYGDGLINLVLDDIDNTSARSTSYTVQNAGNIIANAGQIEMTVAQGNATVERLIENKWTGRLQADTIGKDGQGQIVLGGGTNDIDNSTTVLAGGTIETRGLDKKEIGGSIQVLGDQVAIMDNAVLDASGTDSAGRIHIGGEYLGQGDTKRARATIIENTAKIKANGGNGEVIVWSDKYTNFKGTIDANGGNGFVETSSKEILSATGRVNAENGQWLLDPGNIDIRDDAGGAPDDSTIAGPTFDSIGVDSVVTTEAIEASLAGADVTVVTSGGGASQGDITVTDTIQYTGGADRTLTLRANDDIIINNATIDSTTGALNVVLNSDYDRVSNTLGDGFVDIRNSTFTTNGGDFVIGGGADPYINPVIGDGTNELAGTDPAIYIDNSPISTGAGDVIIRGINSTMAGNIALRGGVQIINNSHITTTSGSITLYGETQHTAGANRGLTINNSNLLTTTGGITLEGVGTDDNGVHISSGTTIAQSGLAGTGDVSITGTTSTGMNGIAMTANTPAVAFAGDLSMRAIGGDLFLFRRPIQKTGAGSSNITLRADNDVRLTGIAATNLTTTGNPVNLTVTADYDNDGSGDVYFNDFDTDVSGGNMTIRGHSMDIADSDLVSNNGGAGNVTIRSDAFSINTADSTIQVAEDLVIAPHTGTTAINLGPGVGALDISAAELGRFTIGENFILGDSSSGSGAVNIDNITLASGYDLEVYGGAVTVANSLSNNGTILLSAANGQDININSTITSTAAGNSLVLNATGDFINNFGAGALNSGAGRFIIYSKSLDNIMLGGLTGSKIYGATYSTLPPSLVQGTMDSIVLATQLVGSIVDNEILQDPDIPAISDDTTFIIDDTFDNGSEDLSNVFIDFNTNDELSFSFGDLTENSAVVFNADGYSMISSDYVPQIGDYIRTGLDFGFIFESDENAIIKMTRSSSMRMKKVFYSPDGNNSAYFDVEEGAVGFFSDRDKHKGEIKTILPGVAIKVTGTCYIVDLKKKENKTNIILFGGGIELYIKGQLVKLRHPIQMISFGADGVASSSEAIEPVPLTMNDVREMFIQKPEVIPSKTELLKCGVPASSL